MIAYVGLTSDTTFVEEIRRRHIGRIQQRGLLRLKAIYKGERWIFDNGAYSDFLAKRPFDGDQYLKDVGAIQALESTTPMFCVVPDMVGKGERSLAFSLDWLNRIPFTWRRYLVVQDGMTQSMVAPVIEQFDGIFLGGTDAFKSTAWVWSSWAHNLGMPFHYGRASTPKKLTHAWEVGSDSCDTSFPLWTRERMHLFLKMADRMAVTSPNPDRLFA